MALLIVTLILTLHLAAQDSSKSSAGGNSGDKSTGKPNTMKLYDVPSPRETGGQTPEEVAEYVAIGKATDPKSQVELIEAFIKKYPSSQYVPGLHQFAANDYQLIGNPDKLIEHAEKVLETTPQNAPFLAILSVTYAARGETEKAIDRGNKAVTLLDSAEPAPKVDPTMFAAQKNRLLSIAYTGLGAAYLERYEKSLAAVPPGQSKDAAKPASEEPATSAAAGQANPGKEGAVSKGEPTEKAVTTPGSSEALDLSKAKGYFARALELDPGYEFAQFQMAVTYTHEKQVAQSLESFAKVMAMGGGLANLAKQNFERIYKLTHNNSLAGSEELLEKAKAAWADQKAAAKPPAPPKTAE
ncbi:MAG: hypothetical protein U0V70_14690 [Terriglobia bacterium]